MSNDSKYTLGPIYIVNFFGTLGFSIVFPFLVFLNLEFGLNFRYWRGNFGQALR